MTSGCNISTRKKKSQKEHFTNGEFQISELQRIKKYQFSSAADLALIFW